jgi:hypothetical protein
MQRYTIFFIIVNALHASGGFSAHYQELKNCTHSIGYMQSLFAATAGVGVLELQFQLTHGFCAIVQVGRKSQIFYGQFVGFNVFIAGNSCHISPVHPQQSLLTWSSE